MQKLNLKEMLVPTASLFVICLVIAGSLALVNAVTMSPIAPNATKEADEARQVIFPGARFVDEGGYFTAMDQNGALIGYCIDSGAQGYGGLIEVAVGLDTQGNVLKVQVVAADGETPGLGQKVKESTFLDQFTGKAGALALGGGIDSIASATYSSRGVVDAVNKALEIYNEEIKGGEAQ